MANLFDYIAWRGDLSFAQCPVCAVDSLVFAALSYANLEVLVPDGFPSLSLQEAAEALMARPDHNKLVRSENDGKFLLTAARSPRFRFVQVCCCRAKTLEDLETQFGAMAFLLPDGSAFLAFRGTDLTLVGWKEDFNMSYLETVPAQTRAAAYAEEVARLCPRHKLRIGGHSKGGNLAAWAGLHLPPKTCKRLLAVYNNDGPGFNRSMTETPEYALVKDRLHTFIPESSIVGVLLEHCEDYTVIASTAKSIMQHEALSWCTECNHFIHLEERSAMGRRSDDVVRDWLSSMTAQERRDFTDAFFEILSMGGKAKTLDDVQEMGLGGAVALVKEFAGSDEKTRRILTEIFKRLAVDIGEEMASSAQDGLKQATGFIRGLGRKKTEKKS